MRMLAFAISLTLICSDAVAQFTVDTSGTGESPAFAALDGELFQLSVNLDEARLALLCSVSWDGHYPVDETHFSDLAYEKLAVFVALARDDDFQLPEYSEGLTPYLVEAIDAPNADIAVGLIFAEFRAGAEATLLAHQNAIDEVEIDESFQWVTRRLEAGRIYRCEDLAMSMGLAGGQ